MKRFLTICALAALTVTAVRAQLPRKMTVDITPDGRYVVAACNFSSRLVVVDTESFKEIARIKADSYPVGLDISKDGKYVYTTSQGREGGGGNCVDIYQMDY